MDAGGATKQLPLNQEKLKRAWEVSQRTTKDDWDEWMVQFSLELLRESPSPALRSCCTVAQVRAFANTACCSVCLLLHPLSVSCRRIART